jgi:hypothetical protein
MNTYSKLNASERATLAQGVIQVSGKAMNRTALGIVHAMVKLYPYATFNELKEMLPDYINPSAPKNYKSIFKPFTKKDYGVIQPGFIRKECQEQNCNISDSHFTGEEEIFRSADGVEVLVSRTWETRDTETGEKDLQNLINHVQKFGVLVVDFKESKPFTAGGYSHEVINPVMMERLLKVGKKNYLWILIVIALILGGLIYYYSH